MDKKNGLIIIIKNIFGGLMILWAILLSLICCLFAFFDLCYGSYGAAYMSSCLAVIFPLLNILGTSWGNSKSPWYYLFYLPSILVIIVPIIIYNTRR